jgi:integration host factor subunit alpha
MAERTVTRADLADALVQNANAQRADAARFVESFLASLESAIVAGQTVKLARFGNFVVRQKRQRVGRNPKTGQEVPITSRRVVTFRPSQLLRDRVGPK